MTTEVIQLGILKTMAAQDDEIKTLRAQVAQYKEDAERYRFLRRLDAAGLQVYDGPNDCSIFGDDLDAAIDKARKS